MIKYLKYIPLVVSIILSILLVINIYKYNNIIKTNQSLIDDINNYKSNIIDTDTKKNELEKELSNLKETKQDKIAEYNRWIKWNKEIQEKIN